MSSYQAVLILGKCLAFSEAIWSNRSACR